MSPLTITAHGLVHVPLSEASDVALCGDVGERVPQVQTVTCSVCVAALRRKMGHTAHGAPTTEGV